LGRQYARRQNNSLNNPYQGHGNSGFEALKPRPPKDCLSEPGDPTRFHTDGTVEGTEQQEQIRRLVLRGFLGVLPKILAADCEDDAAPIAPCILLIRAIRGCHCDIQWK